MIEQYKRFDDLGTVTYVKQEKNDNSKQDTTTLDDLLSLNLTVVKTDVENITFFPSVVGSNGNPKVIDTFTTLDCLKATSFGLSNQVPGTGLLWAQFYPNFEKLILRSDSVVTLNNTAGTEFSLSGTKIGSLIVDCGCGTWEWEPGTGGIYVPDELVDDYKSDTNWSFFGDSIKPISSL